MPLPFKSDFDVPPLSVTGGKALVITTSHGTLDTIDPATGAVTKTGKPTGVYASEMTDPYYVFSDAGMSVDVASIRGGEIPIEKQSLGFMARTEYDKRYLADPEFQAKTKNSLCVDDLNFNDYDIIFMSGGWGAAYDLAQSEVLGQKISEAYAANKILGSACHGALGFLGAQKPDGSPLVQGVKMTGVTDKQIKQLGITVTPKHPESELRKAGADFECNHRFVDLIANHVVVNDEHRMVTAQNQKGGVEAAVRAVQMLAALQQSQAA